MSPANGKHLTLPLPPPPSPGLPSSGLRERKKRATRAAIQRAALALFSAKGYDATTTEEVARAAEVSSSTLFNYFPSKEALVTDDYDPLLVHLLQSRPQDEPMFTAIRSALEEGLATFVQEDRDLLMIRAKLVLEVPALRAAALLDKDRSAALLQQILVERYGRWVDEFEIRVTSAVICSAMETAMQQWMESGGSADVMKLISRALDVVELGARIESRQTKHAKKEPSREQAPGRVKRRKG